MSSIMNAELSIVPIANNFAALDTEVAVTKSGVEENKKKLEALKLQTERTQKGIEAHESGIKDLERADEANRKEIEAQTKRNAALDQDMNAWPFNSLDKLISSTCATVTPCMKKTCYVIAGCVVGAVVGGVSAFAADKNSGAGAAIGALAGLTVVGVALCVNKLCQKHFRCCIE